MVFFDESDLIGVEGVPSFPPNKVDGFEIVHSAFDESDCHEHRSSSESSDAMNSDSLFWGISIAAAAAVVVVVVLILVGKSGFDEADPILEDLAWRGLSITEWPVIDLDARPFDPLSGIRFFAYSHEFLDVIFFHFSNVLREVIVAGSIHDEEPHIFVLDKACSVGNGHFCCV